MQAFQFLKIRIYVHLQEDILSLGIRYDHIITYPGKPNISVILPPAGLTAHDGCTRSIRRSAGEAPLHLFRHIFGYLDNIVLAFWCSAALREAAFAHHSRLTLSHHLLLYLSLLSFAKMTLQQYAYQVHVQYRHNVVPQLTRSRLCRTYICIRYHAVACNCYRRNSRELDRTGRSTGDFI